MDTRILVPVVIAAVVILVIAALLVMRKRKSDQLKQRFGSEYDRVVQQNGGARHAEDVLAQREKRVEKFSIRPLSEGDRQRYTEEWALVQKRFVDDPSIAVTEADKLVTTVMGARGYPMVDFEQRAADVSVKYPGVVQNYRSAREIVSRHGKGQSPTEDLRQAMVCFRSLFEELLDSPKPKKQESPMSELLLNDDKLTTADIAHPEKITVAQPSAIDDSNLQPGQAVPAPVTAREATPLFPDDELHKFRTRWDQVQTSFVDEPRQAVEQADSLVANVVKHIAEQFSTERAQLEKQWDSGDNVSTEDLRQALRRYRSFFDRLLAV